VKNPIAMSIPVRAMAHPSQRGISLLFALLALVAMMLAAVALVRSVDSGAMVLGNLGFKQDATSAADSAAELARADLLSGLDLNQNQSSIGYYAAALDNLDPTGRVTTATNKLAVINWGDSDSCACLPATCSQCSIQPSLAKSLNGGRVTARYVISRLCPSTGPVDATNACAKPAAVPISTAACKGVVTPGGRCPDPPAAATPYYRIIVRTVGGRGAVSFTETILH
jgi:type IV pilus assembly protein PilX